jgi:hypothetical protein
MDRYLTTEEVAARYRTSIHTVRAWRHTGTGPGLVGIRIGRRVLWSQAALERYDAELAAEQNGAPAA